MSNHDRPLGSDVKKELGRLTAEFGKMIRLRWRLAELEIRADLASLKRLLIAWITAATMFLAALTLVLVSAAEVLDGVLGVPRAGWMLTLAGLLVTAAGLLGWLSWRRFRGRLVGFEQTLDELREDVRWLNEWAGRDD
jgi:hypothetical protein